MKPIVDEARVSSVTSSPNSKPTNKKKEDSKSTNENQEDPFVHLFHEIQTVRLIMDKRFKEFGEQIEGILVLLLNKLKQLEHPVRTGDQLKLSVRKLTRMKINGFMAANPSWIQEYEKDKYPIMEKIASDVLEVYLFFSIFIFSISLCFHQNI